MCSKKTISKRCVTRKLYPRGVFQGYYIQEVCSKDTISKRCAPRILYPRGVFQGHYIQEVCSKDTISKDHIQRECRTGSNITEFSFTEQHTSYHQLILKRKKFVLKNLCAQILVCARINIFHAYKYVRTNSAFRRWQGIIVV